MEPALLARAAHPAALQRRTADAWRCHERSRARAAHGASPATQGTRADSREVDRGGGRGL